MNLSSVSLKRIAACAALALCLAGGLATTAAAEDGIVGGGDQYGWSYPAGYVPVTSTSVGGVDPNVYKVWTPGCSAWSYSSAQGAYIKSCFFRRFNRVQTAWSTTDYLVGEGLAWYRWKSGVTSCWGTWERPYSWTQWTSWLSGWCPPRWS